MSKQKQEKVFNHHKICKFKSATSASKTLYKIQAIRHFVSMLRQTYATATTWLITSCPCTTVVTYPGQKASNSKL